MTIAGYIELALTLAQAALSAANVNGLAPEIVADLEASVAALRKVQGTPVTWEQLNGLRVQPTF